MSRTLFALACAALITVPAALADSAAQRTPTRIIAVGDVHGAAASFAAILQRAGLINEARQWTGGRTILVQTGDMTDRGAATVEGLDLLMSLERQAQKAGGRVHALLGNHEVMNLAGELRDASPEMVAALGGEARAREAFGPRGQYGRWLRGKPVALLLHGTVFMHAGINPEFSPESIEDINRRAKRELAQWDEGVRWLVRQGRLPEHPAFREAAEAARIEIEKLNAAAAAGEAPLDAPVTANLLLPVANIGVSSLFHADGPLWFRGFATWTDDEGAPLIAALLKRHRAVRFVSGHTVQPGGEIRDRFNGSVQLIDTGMLDGKYFPGGRPSALEIIGSDIREIYLDR